MSAKSGSTPLKAGWRLFARHNKGAAAVEFALVAAPLVFLICSCIELALVVVLSVTLDNATDQAARQIRTGVTTSSNSTADTFRQKICDNMGWLSGSCMGSLKVDVQTYTNFSDVAKTDLIVNGKFDTTNFKYTIGTGSKIQLVRAYYEWRLFVPGLSHLANLSGSRRLLTSGAAFRNEPFGS